MFEELHIHGLRGFATNQVLKFAVPDGTPGSGLTVLVGANNSGKSTVIEALRAMSLPLGPFISFTQGRRNIQAGDFVKIKLTTTSGGFAVLQSTRKGSSETTYDAKNVIHLEDRILTLPSRRTFRPHFAKELIDRRSDYVRYMGFPANRFTSLDQFTARLFAIEKNRADFDAVLKKVIDPVPDWTIDQMDNGEYFLKFNTGTATHSSEGLGEGLVSLFYIIDALYDSKDSNLIAIDEPELSLHPALQRRLSTLLMEYAASRQIVIATHSPYMAPLKALPNGATIARVHKENGDTVISQLTDETGYKMFHLTMDQNNPHVFGTNALEIFFIQDGVILTEGQEDVVFLERVQESVGTRLEGEVFGWGVGGADKMRIVANALKELGFTKVVGILDGNRRELAEELKDEFPTFLFLTIPANDIRTKRSSPEKPAVAGLLDDTNQQVREEHRQETTTILQTANQYLKRTD